MTTAIDMELIISEKPFQASMILGLLRSTLRAGSSADEESFSEDENEDGESEETAKQHDPGLSLSSSFEKISAEIARRVGETQKGFAVDNISLLDFNRNKGSNAGNVSHHDIVYRALILIKHLLQQAMAPRQEVNTFFQQMGYVLARMGANS